MPKRAEPDVFAEVLAKRGTVQHQLLKVSFTYFTCACSQPETESKDEAQTGSILRIFGAMAAVMTVVVAFYVVCLRSMR
jgi:hypothetical protein